MPDKDPNTGMPLDVGLHGLEPHGNSKKQDGFFHKGVLQALESDHVSGGKIPEVKIIANGHCHCMLRSALSSRSWLIPGRLPVTENCRRIKGVWNCFSGGG